MTTITEALAAAQPGDDPLNIAYLRNNQTGEVITYGDRLGVSFKNEPWEIAEQIHVDEKLFTDAIAAKLAELNLARSEFVALGFSYGENIFCLTDQAAMAILGKEHESAVATDRCKFYCTSGADVDFVDIDGWCLFKKAFFFERDRVQRYYILKKAEISALAYPGDEVADIDAVTIDFTV